MKIHVPSIPEFGRSYDVNAQEKWVQETLQKLTNYSWIPEEISGKVDLYRTNLNITVHANLHLAVEAFCDRCAKGFVFPVDVAFTRNIVPAFSDKIPKNSKFKTATNEQEIELNEEDLEFSSYHDEEIDLGEILAEEILLAMPMRFFCTEDCPGLCPYCGINLREQSCSCQPVEVIPASPFAALKEFPLKKK